MYSIFIFILLGTVAILHGYTDITIKSMFQAQRDKEERLEIDRLEKERNWRNKRNFRMDGR